jgi:hypothetical protein
VTAQIGRHVQGPHSLQQQRAADGGVRRRKEPVDAAAVIVPIAIADEGFGLVVTHIDTGKAREMRGLTGVDGIQRGRHAQLDLGMRGSEFGQMTEQPTRRESRR